ncbi:bifunctional DNA-formamidopyrimidine glycosylase/DNA-(apurinic or apyrimidinic site) lyase [Cutibacterium namnetense]|uniref:Formamidopyrimidine-DNA glycosylase n=1 Tax=Cutibacterium namnetense TaxID=1574624 RepID=A0ABX9I7W7_9ACTN|nr:bifunctional DNA-formamidopyrimidine glycosylase/DNA-(apurinic or apyrimidinic site) lyase [Cutibacterium namnetense]REB68651.1 bifunctional DNA-formamidopyrimidine glycosylase/DNA-(apurinic or apyrimidinic site) lyase [Cutibacterium namnetense]TKW73168.1 MAG: bifunctional DNA-formamidopyrimidine glycosylase/DNA-(apurinic or apyrimidinic site) lyase [Cutibacterium acnes]
MPELPEVETVRAGLENLVIPAVVESVDVVDARGLRPSGEPEDAAFFETVLTGRQLTAVSRRGKYLWFVLDDDTALLAHLGMSGHFRVVDRHAPQHRHTRIVIALDEGRDLRFLDQRTFGGLTLTPLLDGIPGPVTHIAPDPFEECFDADEVARRLCARRSTIKRSLLDQTLVSGIGNIYADETLWRVRRHPETPCSRLSQSEAVELLQTARDVMAEAMSQGGTSFDSLYVNVNGEPGWFSRVLDAYGREDEPCPRCGTPIVRESFMNRSSFRCPRCQRLR